MEKVIEVSMQILKGMMALLLLGMVILVFTNVVLRYSFNSGISISEELSRWFMVWMTFLAAVVGVREKGHLNVDSLIKHLPPLGQKACHLLMQGIVLYLLWLFGSGSWQQAVINLDVPAPMTGLPMATIYLAGVVFSALSAVVVVFDLYKVFSGAPVSDVHTALNAAD